MCSDIELETSFNFKKKFEGLNIFELLKNCTSFGIDYRIHMRHYEAS